MPNRTDLVLEQCGITDEDRKRAHAISRSQRSLGRSLNLARAMQAWQDGTPMDYAFHLASVLSALPGAEIIALSPHNFRGRLSWEKLREAPSNGDKKSSLSMMLEDFRFQPASTRRENRAYKFPRSSHKKRRQLGTETPISDPNLATLFCLCRVNSAGFKRRETYADRSATVNLSPHLFPSAAWTSSGQRAART